MEESNDGYRSITRERRGGEEIAAGTVKAGTAVATVPALISLPKIKWNIVLPWAKRIFLVMVAGGIVFGIIKGVVYFKPWQKLGKQPAVMVPFDYVKGEEK